MLEVGRICIILALGAAWCEAVVKHPPYMIRQPHSNEELLFQVASRQDKNAKPLIIECEADGKPAPKYRWLKDGKDFDWQTYGKRISQQPGHGTLTIPSPRDEDQGQYQCFAENELGTATSNSVFVRKSELNSFKIQDPITETVNEGDPIGLKCQPPDGYPKPQVYWMIQDDRGALRSINSSRMTVDPEGTLWFTNVTRIDESNDFTYSCSATSSLRNEYKLGNRVYLRVNSPSSTAVQSSTKEPKQQFVSRKNIVITKGKTLELWCIYSGTPLPVTKWRKIGGDLPFDRITIDNHGKSLILNDVEYEDAGQYECETSNGVGVAKSYTMSVQVEAVPSFIQEPEIQNKAVGETAEFVCETEGNPPPHQYWIFNGMLLDKADPNPRRIVENNKITIYNLTNADTGNYGCNSSNIHGYVYKDAYVNVLDLPPEIITAPIVVESVDGQTVHITCRVIGAPKPRILWVKDMEFLRGGRYTISDKGDLIIRNVTFADEGDYTCFAENKFGKQEAHVILAIKRRTEIADAPEDYEVAAGQTATFRCNAKADNDLELKIHWMKGEQEIDFANEPRFVQKSDYSLSITNTTELDSGIYTCVARTILDEVKKKAVLIVKGLADCEKDTNYTLCNSIAITEECQKNSTVRESCKFSCSSSGQLQWAALKGNITEVNTSIAAGANPLCQNYFPYMKAIHIAAKHNHPEVIVALLDYGVDVNLQLPNGDTPTVSASKSGSIDALEVLIEHNADVNIADSQGYTPLMKAAGNGHLSVTKVLIEHNADVNIAGNYGMTALMQAARYGHLDVAKVLIKANASVNVIGGWDNTTALYYAILGQKIYNTDKNQPDSFSYPDVALLLIEHNADVNIPFGRGWLHDDARMTPLMKAVSQGQLGLVKALINANADLDVLGGRENATALYYAVDGTKYRDENPDREEIALLLIEHNANVNIPTKEGMTPLMEAAARGEFSIAKVLINANASIDVTGRYGLNGDATALYFAILNNNQDIALLLIEHNADTNIATSSENNWSADRMTPLMRAAQRGQLSVTKALINANARINVMGGFDNATALYYAVSDSYPDTALLLIEHNADVNIPAANGMTPLMQAAQRGQFSVAKVLINANASINVTGGKYNATALYYATKNNNLDISLFLIKHDADVNIPTFNGMTPLMQAARQGQLSLAKALVNDNASLDVTGGFDNATALHYAASSSYDSKDIVFLLLQSGADTRIQDGDGRTPAGRAGHFEQYHLAEYIDNYSPTTTTTIDDTITDAD